MFRGRPRLIVGQDDWVAFPGVIVPTGPQTCRFIAGMYVHPELGQDQADEWVDEMWNQTLLEDTEAVLLRAAGLSSQMVPYGRRCRPARARSRAFTGWCSNCSQRRSA